MIPPALLSQLDRRSFVSRWRQASGLHGERRSRALGSSLEFVEHRGYISGDDPRRIDWNLYGRSNELFVKQFEDQQVLTVRILVDASRSMDFGEPNKLRFAGQVAAALGYVGLAGFDQVTVHALASGRESAADTLFGPAWGRVRAPALLAALERLRVPGKASTEAATDLDAAIASALRRPQRPGLTVLISDLLSPTWEAGLHRLLANRSEVVALHVLAAEELAPSSAEEVRLIDRETGRSVEVRLDRAALDRYGQRLSQWCAAIETLCARRGVRYQRLSTATPVAQVVLEHLTRGGIIR